MALRDFDRAWPLAEELVRRLDDRTNNDALRLQRVRFYRTINYLGRQSRAYDRAIRLLTSRKEPHDGEVDRIQALVEIHKAAGHPRQAARAMDELMAYNIMDPKLLTLCEEVYRGIKAHGPADACRELRLRLKPEPIQRPLWPTKK
jgi:hypothetical protein